MKKIGRTLFWFPNNLGNAKQLNEDFFALATMLNRLLNEKYTGKGIKFINIYFVTNESFQQNKLSYYNGHLNCFGIFDFKGFGEIDEQKRPFLVWEAACESLRRASEIIRNDELLDACNYAYSCGIDIHLDPDYRVVETESTINSTTFKASIWIKFKKDGMRAIATLEKDGIEVFEKEIDRTLKGIEFFLEMYKSVEIVPGGIMVKGRRDVEYLPLFISIPAVS